MVKNHYSQRINSYIVLFYQFNNSVLTDETGVHIEWWNQDSDIQTRAPLQNPICIIACFFSLRNMYLLNAKYLLITGSTFYMGIAFSRF